MPVDNEFNTEEVWDSTEMCSDTAAVIAVEHVIGVSVVSKTDEIHLLWLGINEEIVDCFIFFASGGLLVSLSIFLKASVSVSLVSCTQTQSLTVFYIMTHARFCFTVSYSF